MSVPFAHRVGQAVFWLWIPAASLVAATLMTGHWATLPSPAADDERLHTALAELRTPEEQADWMVVHVLYAACTCSGRVVDHLLADPRPAGVVETILWVGSVPELDARVEAGPFAVVHVRPEELELRFAIEGAPLFFVVDPEGNVRYHGGYTDRKQGLAIRDVEIIERVRASDDVTSLPLFGCPTSDRLRDLLDPFGLRRRAAQDASGA